MRRVKERKPIIHFLFKLQMILAEWQLKIYWPIHLLLRLEVKCNCIGFEHVCYGITNKLAQVKTDNSFHAPLFHIKTTTTITTRRIWLDSPYSHSERRYVVIACAFQQMRSHYIDFDYLQRVWAAWVWWKWEWNDFAVYRTISVRVSMGSWLCRRSVCYRKTFLCKKKLFLYWGSKDGYYRAGRRRMLGNRL